jgi:hypothetical protein
VVTAVDLPLKARLKTGPAGGIGSGVVLLHAEQMRRQTEAVPRVLGEYSRGECVLLRPGLGGPDGESIWQKVKMQPVAGGRRESKGRLVY